MEHNEKNINKFSWRRVYKFGMMYKPSIRAQLIIYAVIIVLVYLCMLLTRKMTSDLELNIGFYTLLSVVVAYLLYVGPLGFARRDDSLMTQVPAKVSEKFAFYMIYSLIVIPVFTEAIWFALNYGMGIFNSDANIECFARTFIAEEYGLDFSSSTIALTAINTIIQSAAIIITVAYVVLRSSSHRVLKGVLTPLGLLFALGIISGIGGVIVALLEISKGTFPAHDEAATNDFANGIISYMSTLSMAVDAILLCYIVLMWYITFSMLKKRQIA